MVALSTSYEALIAKIWYFFSSGASVFVLPYLPLFLNRDLGWQPWQVGLIQGLRPWIAAPCSLLLCTATDRLGIHRAMLITCFVLSTLFRSTLAIVPESISLVAAVILAAEAIGAPVGVIADASVVAKCKQDGDYGKQRVWASIGWGALSTVAGALVTRFGVRYGIVVYGLLCIPAVAAAWVLKPGPKPSEEVQGAGYGEGAGKGLKAPKASKAPSVGQDMLNALLAKAAAADEDPKAATPLPASLSLDVAPQPVAQQQQAAARPPTPLSPHALHATLSHDAGLRTRLLASYARSPSPSPRGASIQPYAGPIDAAASPPQPQLNTAPRGAGSGDDASCCSTPRSTAALLPNEFQRSAAPSPSPRAMRALGRAVAPAEGAERQQQAAAATDPYAPNATTPQQRLSLPLEDLIDLDGNSDLLDPEAAGTPPQTPCAARTPNAAGGPVSCSPFSRGVQVGQLIAAAAALEEDNGAHVSLGAGAGAVCTGVRAAERTAPVIGDRGGGQVDGVVVLSLSRATSRHALLGPEGVRQDSAAPDRPGTAAAAAAVASAQYLPTSTRATRSSDPGSLPVVEGHEGCSTDSAGRKLPVGVQDQQLGVVSLLAQPRVMTFMLRSLLIGYGLGAQGSFAFLLVQQLGGNALLMGLMLVFSILTEAPAFQFQSALLARVHVTIVMHASMVLLAVRLGCYALLPMAPSPWAVLPVELLHGCTFATSWGAGIVSCKRMAPPHLNTTMQSVFSALYGGVGSGLGGILGGLLMQKLGAAAMFAVMSATLMGGWAVTWALDAAIAAFERKAVASDPVGTLRAGSSASTSSEGSRALILSKETNKDSSVATK